MMDLLFLFLTSVVISLSTFGGGAQALFYQYAVVEHNWINTRDLSAVLAFGYATPGPAVFGSSTFIGYHLYGLTGAIIGSLGIFVVPFAGATIATKYLSPLLKHRRAAHVIRAVSLAMAGIVLASAYSLFSHTRELPWQVIALVVTTVVCIKYKVSPSTLILGGVILGIVLS